MEQKVYNCDQDFELICPYQHALRSRLSCAGATCQTYASRVLPTTLIDEAYHYTDILLEPASQSHSTSTFQRSSPALSQ